MNTERHCFRYPHGIVRPFQFPADPTRRFAKAKDPRLELEQPPDLGLAQTPELGDLLRGKVPLAGEPGQTQTGWARDLLRHRRDRGAYFDRDGKI